MKKIFILLALLLSVSVLNAKNLVAYFDYNTFYSPDDGGIIETYLNFEGHSVNYMALENGLFKAQLEVVIIVSSGDDVVDYIKKEVNSPSVEGDNYVNFLDQSRFVVPDGSYNIEVKIIDLNSTDKKPYIFNKNIVTKTSLNEIFFSDVELLAGYRPAAKESMLAKSGYDLLPYFSNYYSPEFTEMMFYIEAYNTSEQIGKGKPLLLTYSIQDPNSSAIIGNMRKFKKLEADAVLSQIGTFDITKLYSGTYNLVIELKDVENNILSTTKQKIIRDNTDINVTYSEEDIDRTFVGQIKEKDTVMAYINSLRPICEASEMSVLRQMDDLEILRLKSFFYSFWHSRNAEAPEAEWLAYRKRVKYVDEEYGTPVKDGYETHMGRVTLKYGDPDVVAFEDYGERTWPYQIWHYKENDYKFVFYSPQIVANEFDLLHTNVRGEPRMQNWPLELNRVNTLGQSDEGLDRFNNNLDNQNNNYIARLLELFNHPR